MDSDFSDGSPASQSDQENQNLEVQIDLTPEFQQNLRDLSKRYRNIRADIQVIIDQLQVGEFTGNRLEGIGKGYVVLKVRVQNRDIKKGKSAGYRLIYLIESPTSILLLTIYSKSDREDISPKELRDILSEFYKSN